VWRVRANMRCVWQQVSFPDGRECTHWTHADVVVVFFVLWCGVVWCCVVLCCSSAVVVDTTQVQRVRGVHKFTEKASVRIAVYSDGILVKRGPFRSFTDDKKARQFILVRARVHAPVSISMPSDVAPTCHRDTPTLTLTLTCTCLRQDMMDGYFPSEFKGKYPEGVRTPYHDVCQCHCAVLRRRARWCGDACGVCGGDHRLCWT